MTWIEEAVKAGAKVLAGGDRKGTLVQPTLLEDVPLDVRLCCQEVFGPVLTLGRVESLSEAVSKVNASPYGIHASLFANDEESIRQAEEEIEVAGIVVNDYPTLRFDNLPYGGVKESGFGREGVMFAVQEMTEPKSIVRRKS
jgi:acyl-CoA reductase-like NAD-dependent aldehyde dehydrogenase